MPVTAKSGWLPATGLLVGPAVAVSVLIITGALAPPGNGLPDPGAPVRWGLPAAKVLRDLVAAAAVGFLIAAATLLPGPGGRRPATLTVIQVQTVRLGAAAASVWACLSFVLLILTYADLAGQPLTAPETWLGVPSFATTFQIGQPMALSMVLALSAAWTAQLATRPGAVGVACVLALAALLPLAWTGHAAGARNHTVAIDTQIVHLVGVALWVGGLVAIMVTRRLVGDQFPIVVGRFSTLAGWCFLLVAGSGVGSAVARMGSWASLTTVYLSLLVAKSAALTALGFAGWYHRRALLPRLGDAQPGRTFARIAGAELIVMAAAFGLAVALSRTPPNQPGAAPPVSLAEELLGYPMPPPLTFTTVFTAWRPDPLWLPLAALAAWWYLRAVLALRTRGHRWPLRRTVSFLTGCVALTLATSGSPGVYGQVLFSMHMVQHMTVATAVPTFLVLGAPITLAFRTLHPRTDGSRGLREWLLAAVHSAPSRVISHPLVAAALFIGSLVIFYYSPLFDLSLRTHAGHLLMITHFLITGYLFANVICGIDPGPARPPYPFRLVLLIMIFSFHAFFAVSLMSGGVLGQEWYQLINRDWGNTLAEDQALGAALSWALGDYPVAILAVALVWSWIKADTREANRYDRQASRDNDAELATYNERLKRLARNETRG